MFILIHMRRYVCVYLCVYFDKRVHMCACKCMCLSQYMRLYICAYACVYLDTYVCVYE